MDFHKISLQDKGWVEQLLSWSDYNSCEYSFSSLLNWSHIHQTEVCRMGDFGIVRSGFKEFSYLYPFGRGDIAPVIEAILQDARENQVTPTISLVLEPMKQQLQTLFPDRFCFEEERAYFDYIYTFDTLAYLKGRNLSGKRNHINTFHKMYEGRWSFETITPENIGECVQMNQEWGQLNELSLGSGLLKEKTALTTAFENFFEEGLRGGLLRLDGKVIAFTMGRPLNSDTFVVHFEKAFSDIRGAYQMINQQFVLNCCQGYSFINREDDTGMEGLRKAKLSYLPEILLTKYNVRLIEDGGFLPGCQKAKQEQQEKLQLQ